MAKEADVLREVWQFLTQDKTYWRAAIVLGLILVWLLACPTTLTTTRRRGVA